MIHSASVQFKKLPVKVVSLMHSSTAIVLARKDIADINLGSMLDLPSSERAIEIDGVYKVLRNNMVSRVDI